MIIRAFRAAILILIGALVSTSGSAENLKDKGGYVGGAFGFTGFEDDNQFAGLPVDDDGTSFQIYGGYKFLRYFALEGRLLNLGSYSVAGVKTDVGGATVNAVGILPLGSTMWELFAQLGFGRVNLETQGIADRDETVGSFGIGVRVTPIEHLSISLQIDGYGWENDNNPSQTFDQGIGTNQIAFHYNF